MAWGGSINFSNPIGDLGSGLSKGLGALGGGISRTFKDISKGLAGVDPMGQTTEKINPEDFIKPVKVENPYVAELEKMLGKELGPDFTGASNVGKSQIGFAGELEKLFGAGSAGLTGLISTLQKQQAGDFGPGGSLAQKVLEQGLGQNIAGVRSQLASQRGLSPALAARYAAQQTAQLGGQTAQQAGLLGLQQQLAAQQLLGSLTGTAAGLGSKAGDIYGTARTQEIEQAKAKSDADLKRLNILASSDTGIRQIQAQTGISENEIRAKIAAANQAAAAGDMERRDKILGSITGAFASEGAKKAFGTAGGAGGAAGAAPAAGGLGLMYSGGRIDGHAPVQGDSPKNDVVPAQLSPGEIVIPRSAAGSREAAKAFIDALDDWDEEPSYGKVLKARQKKNYADGGVVEPDLDQEILDKYRSQQMKRSYEAPIPAVEGLKQGLDTTLTENIVEPLARRGYENLGAGIATVPSTLAEALLPGSMAEMQTVIPLPGAKLSRMASQQIKKENAKELLEKMSADDVDISKLPSAKEYKKFAKESEQLKKSALRQAYQEEAFSSGKEKLEESKDIFEKVFGKGKPKEMMTGLKGWELEQLAYDNANIPEIKKALDAFSFHGQKRGGMTVQGALSTKEYVKAQRVLFEALKDNKNKLKFSDELERTLKVKELPKK